MVGVKKAVKKSNKKQATSKPAAMLKTGKTVNKKMTKITKKTKSTKITGKIKTAKIEKAVKAVKKSKVQKKPVVKQEVKKIKKKPVSQKTVKTKKGNLTAVSKAKAKMPIKKTHNTKYAIVSSLRDNKNIDKNRVMKREQTKMKQHKSIGHSHSDVYEDYMTLKNKVHFREILLNWKKQLLGEMERTVHHMQDDVAAFADPNDRATQEEEFSIELRTRDRERKLIKKIEEALTKLESNDYGYCEDCGIEIGLKRLEARPTATLCIDCKTIEEIREKSSSD